MKTGNMTVAVLAIMALLALSANAGTVTMVTPATSDVVTGVYIMNASADFNATWCAFYAFSADTANSSASNMIRNATHDYGLINNSVNASFDSRILEDANSYNFNATCANQTGTTYAATASTSVIVDNTVPAVPEVNTPDGFEDDDTNLNFNATVLANQTVTCTLRFLTEVPRGLAASVSITEGSGLCTRVATDVGNGAFRYSFTASDGRNTTAESTVRTLLATQDGNRQKSLVIPVATAQQLAGGGMSNGMKILLLVAGLAIVWALSKKR